VSLDITTLRLLKYRDRYDRLRRSVPKGALAPLTTDLLNDFGVFFREFSDAKRIDHGPFITWYRGFRHPNMKDDNFALYSTIIAKSMEDIAPELEAGLMERLVAADTASVVTGLIEKWNNGDEIDLYKELRNSVERFE